MAKTEDLIARNARAIEGRLPGDIIFFHPETFNPLAHLIVWITNQYYHHGAIVISEDEVIEGDPFLGVHTGKVNDYLGKYTLDLFRLKDRRNADLVVKNAQDMLGWEYDYRNVFFAFIGWIFYWTTGLRWLRVLKNPVDEENSVHSEEFIDIAYSRSGINLKEKIPATNVTAQDLSESDALYRVNL